MKKIHSYLLLLAATLMMATACSKDNDVLAPNDDDNNPQPHTYLAPCFTADAGSTVETRTLTISPNGQADANTLDARHSSSAQGAATGSHAADADTRAVVEDNPNYRNGELFRWVADEEVLVWFEKADGSYQTITYKITNVNEALCDLVPVNETAVIEEGDYTVYGMYPADKWTTLMNGSPFSFSVIPQYGQSSEFPGRYSPMKSAGKKITVKQGETFGLSFEHLSSMLRVSFTNDSDNSGFYIDKIIIKDGAGSSFLESVTCSGENSFHPSKSFNDYVCSSTNTRTLAMSKFTFSEKGVLHAYVPIILTKAFTGPLIMTLWTYTYTGGTQFFLSTSIDAEKVNEVWSEGFQPGYSYYLGSKLSSLTEGKSNLILNSTTAGSITQELIRKRLSPMGTLKVTGTINTTDLSTLNSWSSNKLETDMKLSHLDLSEATISGTTEFPASFKGNTDLISISLPATEINSLAVNAFDGCSKLSSVALPADNGGFTTIGNYAFRNCAALTNIVIPNSVESIGIYAFRGCTSLQSVTLPTNSAYTSIANYLFAGCTSLEKIDIPDNVESIGSSAFLNCESLQSVTLPTTRQYTTIANSLFAGCTSLEKIDIPSHVTSIEKYAFRNCESLQSVTLPTNSEYTTIANSLFAGCTSLEKIEIPSNVKSIGQSAFSGCSNKKLTEIVIPNSVDSIGLGAFIGCESLQSVTLPTNSAYTEIADRLFAGCTSLEKIEIPRNVTSIGNYAFQNCSSENLTEIVIPDNVRSIGQSAFQDCTGLQSVTLPTNSAYTTIADYLFANCTSLASIEIPSSVTRIEQYAFRNCPISSLVFEVTEEQALSSVWNFNSTAIPSGTSYKLFLPNVTTADVASGVYRNLTPVPSGTYYNYNGDISTATKADKINTEKYLNQR